MKEQRLAFRYPLILPVGVPTFEGILQGRTRDISAWGVYFTLDRRLELGTKFMLSIMLPEAVTGGIRVSVNGQGKVVRVEADSTVKHVGIAALIENRQIVRLGESRA